MKFLSRAERCTMFLGTLAFAMVLLLGVYPSAYAQSLIVNVDTIREYATDEEYLSSALASGNDSIPLGKLKRKMKKTGSIISRFIRSFDDYDSTYITPNYYNYTAMLQNTNFYQVYRLKATSSDNVTQQLQLAPSPALKIGPYFGWRWIFLGYTFDVGNMKKAVKTTEFNLSLYSSMLGCDLVYIRNAGDFTIKKAIGFGESASKAVAGRGFSGMKAHTASANVYYVFNHRHFSFPAAYAQSTVQRRSCGSWMLGLNYSHQRLDFDYTQLPPELLSSDSENNPLIDELKISNINYQSFSFSGGYAYNWVFARNFLLSAALTPQLGIKHSKGERLSGESIWFNMRNLKLDFIARAGLVWNNTHWFAGASVVSHFFDYKRAAFNVTNIVNYVNIYAGFTFNRKRQYRNRSSLK